MGGDSADRVRQPRRRARGSLDGRDHRPAVPGHVAAPRAAHARSGRRQLRARPVGDRRDHRPRRDDHLRQRQVLRGLALLARRADRAGPPPRQLGLSLEGIHQESLAHDRQRADLARRDPQPHEGRDDLLGGHDDRAVPRRRRQAVSVHGDSVRDHRSQAIRGAAARTGGADAPGRDGGRRRARGEESDRRHPRRAAGARLAHARRSARPGGHRRHHRPPRRAERHRAGHAALRAAAPAAPRAGGRRRSVVGHDDGAAAARSRARRRDRARSPAAARRSRRTASCCRSSSST